MDNPGTTAIIPEARLFCKMAKVMGIVNRVPKSGYNDHHKYKYAKADDVADAIREAMSESNLALFVDMGEIGQEVFEYTDSYGKQKSNIRTTIKFMFTFACGDTGATRSSPWTGQVDDNSDKAISKCATVAEKYFLMKTFIVSAGDEPDADADKHREEVGNKVVPKWFQEDRALYDLSERAFTAGLIKERNGKGVAEMEAMIAPKTWADYADRAAAALAIKEIVEARRQAAAQSASTNDDADSPRQQPDKPAEPVIDEPGAAALAAGDVVPGASPFDNSAPQVNPDTGVVETPRNGSASDKNAIPAAVLAQIDASIEDIPTTATSPHYHKKADNGAVKTMLDGMPTISGN